jgi:hypothetical protein
VVYPQGRNKEMRDPMLFSVKHAVCYLGPTLEISILGCSRRYLLSAVQGDIYSRLFKEISTLGCSRRYLLSAVQGDNSVKLEYINSWL